MNKKLPAIQFYPGDWRKDPGVQALDYEHRGVWFEILLLMHESDQRGKLLLNGNPMPDEALARLLGLDLQKLKKIKSTLLDYGVASIDKASGALICRRMVNDEQIRRKRAEGGKKGAKYGKRGGRPPKNPSKTPNDDGEGVNKKPLKNPPSSSSSSSSSSTTRHTGESSQAHDDYTTGFESFWELYGIKKGKKKAWLKWKNLTETERAKIMENVPIFLTHFSSEHYTPRPRKYLYNRYWEDEDYQKQKKDTDEKNNQDRQSRADRYFEAGEELLAAYPDENAANN